MKQRYMAAVFALSFLVSNQAWAEKIEGMVASVDVVKQSLSVLKQHPKPDQKDAFEVYVSSGTEFGGGVRALAEISAGDKVEVQARKDGQGRLEAKEIKRSQAKTTTV